MFRSSPRPFRPQTHQSNTEKPSDTYRRCKLTVFFPLCSPLSRWWDRTTLMRTGTRCERRLPWWCVIHGRTAHVIEAGAAPSSTSSGGNWLLSVNAHPNAARRDRCSPENPLRVPVYLSYDRRSRSTFQFNKSVICMSKWHSVERTPPPRPNSPLI